MNAAPILLRMRADVENLPHAVEAQHELWFADRDLPHAAWRAPLSADPVDVIDVMLTRECEPRLAHLWWARYGFQMREADTLRMFAERSSDLASIIGSALLGSLWRSAICLPDTPADMLLTRSCTNTLWRCLWENPKVAATTVDLRGLVAAHPSTLACMWVQDPGEAYFVQRDKRSASDLGVHLLPAIKQTFAFLPNALQWIDSQGLDAGSAWQVVWDQLEHQDSGSAPLPALA